jgi:nucleotide-binding universal stress UspA family protein
MKEKIPEKVPEVEYKKILYTTDLSERGRFAFHHAASLARRYSAKLTAFHVVEGGAELDQPEERQYRNYRVCRTVL